MPTRPKQHRGVRRRSPEQYERHRQRTSSAGRGYDRRWRETRNAYLREHPFCEQCQADGRCRVAIEVDHVVPMSRGGDRLDWENLQALCRPCHRQKTARDRAAG
jgi:5-methylcytosine-specific restriction protein A